MSVAVQKTIRIRGNEIYSAADLSVHIPYDFNDHPAFGRYPDPDIVEDAQKMIVTLCGIGIEHDNVTNYDSEAVVDCPVCLKIIGIGKRSKIRHSRIDQAMAMK